MIDRLKENPQSVERDFLIAQNMISVDAPDGSGKSVFSKVLEKYLKENFKYKNVFLVYPTKFNQSKGAKRLEVQFKLQEEIKSNSWKHNAYFMGAISNNYKETIIPMLDKDNMVVLDSSEIRSIAYTFDKGDKLAIKSTLNWIKSGRATNNIFSGIRIILNTSPEDLIKNLDKRSYMSDGDPKIFDEVVRRCECYESAVLQMKEIQNCNNTTWINIDNPRYEGSDINGHLLKVIKQELEPTLLHMFNSTFFVKDFE